MPDKFIISELVMEQWAAELVETNRRTEILNWLEGQYDENIHLAEQ